jgi:hypothetical protein
LSLDPEVERAEILPATGSPEGLVRGLFLSRRLRTGHRKEAARGTGNIAWLEQNAPEFSTAGGAGASLLSAASHLEPPVN